MAEGALAHLTVLDLTQGIAGPYCSKLMADYGADVIKVEMPGTGDIARRMPPFLHDDPDPDKSGLFLHLNTNKKGITLNVESETGVKLFKTLVQDADVVVENFRPGTMHRLGLAYETLEKINPRLVMTSISPFGQHGPYRDYEATEMVIDAMGGMMYITGAPDREPLKIGGSVEEYLGGIYGFIGTMTAAFYSGQTGVGQHVDISLMDCVAANLEYTIEMYSYMGAIRRRYYSRHVFAYPLDLMPCKDGHVAILIPQDFELFVRWLGKPALEPVLLGDERFQTGAKRFEYWREFDQVVIPALMERDKREIVESGQAWGMTFGFAANAEDLFDDAHYKERGFFVDVEHPKTGRISYPGAPSKLAETPWQVRHPAPFLGQHNRETYCDRLGLTGEELTRLKATGII